MAQRQRPETLQLYLAQMREKVVFRCADEPQLLALHAQAEAAGLPTTLVTDAGRTQIAAGSRTVAGVGPASAEELAPLLRGLDAL